MELERPDFTQERLSAVQTEFASLTSFVRLAAKEMGFENMEAAMRQDPGSVYVAEKFLSPHHQRGLALIRQGMEQEAASPLKELTNGLWASLKTVVSDVYNFTTTNDSRLRAIALMTAMYMAAIPLYNNPAFMEKMPAFMGGGKPTAAVQQPTQQPSLSPELQQAIEEHLKNNQQAPLPTALRHEVEQHMQKQTVSEEIVSASFEGFSLDGEDLKTTVAVPKSDLQSKILPAHDSTPMFCHPHLGKTTVLHCFFKEWHRCLPQIQLWIQLPTQTFNIEQGFLQQHKRRLHRHIKATRSLE